MTERLHIDKILLGERVRKDMGDLESLAESMKRHGLLHPVVVKKDRTLVAGHRRIEAALHLGWKEIPVTVIEVQDLLSAERDENEVRKDFTPTEAVAIGKLIEEQHREKVEVSRHQVAVEAGKIRQGTITSMSNRHLGAARDVAASAVGMGPEKYTHAKAIVAAAESNPEKFGDLPEKMDESGNVYGTYRELEKRGGLKKNGKRRGFRKDTSAEYKPETKGQRQRAESQKQKMVSSLSIVTGHCRGLSELDVPMALSVCTKEEIKVWMGKAREAGRAFRKFAVKLEKGMKHGN